MIPGRPWRRRLARAAVCLLLGAVTTVGVAWGSEILATESHAGVVENATIISGPFGWQVTEVRFPGLKFRFCYYGSQLNHHAGEEARVMCDKVTFQDAFWSDALRDAAEASAESPHLFREPAWRELPLADWSTRGGWGRLPVDDTIADARAAGWPMLAVWGWKEGGIATTTASAGLLRPGWDATYPYLPLWPGFVIDTLLYAAAWWALLVAPILVKRWRRKWRGACLACGYDLRGLAQEAPCPECGR